MFQNVRNLYRRMIHTERPDSASNSVAEDERRLWSRRPSSLEVAVQLKGRAATQPLTARARDVSRGGISLLVPCAVEPGTLLDVDLPGCAADEKSVVLACVIHCRRQDETSWVIGCTFQEELQETELAAFGARREKPEQAEDNRNWVRFECDVQASFQVIGCPEEIPVSRPAQIANISPRGVGLFVGHPVDNGSLLSITLEGSRSHVTRTILGCVVHVTARPGQSWLLGCSFIRELSESDLQVLH